MNISYTYNKGKSDKKITLKTTDFLVISQKETLQWHNTGDMSTRKKGNNIQNVRYQLFINVKLDFKILNYFTEKAKFFIA